MPAPSKASTARLRRRRTFSTSWATLSQPDIVSRAKDTPDSPNSWTFAQPAVRSFMYITCGLLCQQHRHRPVTHHCHHGGMVVLERLRHPRGHRRGDLSGGPNGDVFLKGTGPNATVFDDAAVDT